MGVCGVMSSSPRSRFARATGAAALFVGGILYLARPTDPAAFGWLDRAGLHTLSQLASATRHAVYANVHLPAWFRGSASDAAYAIALGALLADAPLAIVALGLAVVLGHEVAQGLGLAAGTFDPADLAVLFFSFVLAVFAFRPAPRHPARALSVQSTKRISSS